MNNDTPAMRSAWANREHIALVRWYKTQDGAISGASVSLANGREISLDAAQATDVLSYLVQPTSGASLPTELTERAFFHVTDSAFTQETVRKIAEALSQQVSSNALEVRSDPSTASPAMAPTTRPCPTPTLTGVPVSEPREELHSPEAANPSDSQKRWLHSAPDFRPFSHREPISKPGALRRLFRKLLGATKPAQPRIGQARPAGVQAGTVNHRT